MDLKTLFKGHRKEWAVKLETTVNYVNNICQHPEQCGKKMANKIVDAANGAINLDEILRPNQPHSKAERD